MSITSERKRFLKSTGYTHYISWEEKLKSLGVFVKKGFPTTKDAVNRHMIALSRKKGIMNLKLEEL